MAWRASASAMPPRFSSPIQQQQQQQEEDVDDGHDSAALSISDQRTLYLVNIFIGNTARFLNSFSSICEHKLSQLHRRILHLDATLSLLEAKLESTCPLLEFDDNNCGETKESSSSPLPTDIFSKDGILDTTFEYGESSRGAANHQ